MHEKKEKNKIRVGIIRGGEGKHYKSSLHKGGDLILHIFENLSDKYKVIDILIDKDYIWYMNGLPINPGDLMNRADIVWNTSHSSFYNILESLSIPNVGNGSFLGILENNSDMLRKHIKNIGLEMPRSIVLQVYQKDFSAKGESVSGGDGSLNKYAIKKAKEVFEKFSSPWIVKSYTPDSNMDIHLAKTFPELVNAIEDAVTHRKSILIEEFILGKVASVHSVSRFRGEDIYTFPLGNSFDSFSPDEKEKLISLAKDLHRHVNAKHYLKSDFVLNPRGKVYLLNIESIPDLNRDSHFSQVCESIGTKTHRVIEHILEGALMKKV